MTDHESDRRLERRIIAALDRNAADLDPALEQRLDRARRMALAEADTPRRRWMAWPALVAAGSAALVAITVLVQTAHGPGTDIPALPRTEDLDVLTQEEFEMFTEDPEFYAWIAERPDRKWRPERQRADGEST